MLKISGDPITGELLTVKKQSMKIGFTGPSGSGKTTLANYIASIVPGLSFIPGSAGIALRPEDKEMLEKVYGYKGEGHKAVINKSNLNPDFGLAFQTALLNQRTFTLGTNDDFITDRTQLDNTSYFLMQCSHNQDEHTCQTFITTARNAIVNSLTHLILIRPSDGWTEDNGSRVANNYYQHMTYSVFMGVYERYFKQFLADHNVKVLILDFWDLEQRKDAVEKFIQGE